jgi:CRP/FNR family cyclic AMP-dependent transcriptional regulator
LLQLRQAEKQASPLREKCFEKGSYIFLPEDKANRLFLIVDGRVKIGQYSESGQEIINAILTKEGLFGVRALAEGQSRQEYALAMEHTRCLVLHPQELKAMVHKQPGLSIYIMEQLASRMFGLEKRFGALSFQSSKTRILNFLYELGRQRGQRVGYEIMISKFMTQKEIACLTSTSRQTVNMVLNELRSKNVISFNRKRLLIRDLEELRKIAQASAKHQ